MRNEDGFERLVSAAEAILRQHGGYDWALTNKQFWSVGEASAALHAVGLPFGDRKIREMFAYVRGRWPTHFSDFGGAYGWRISRAGLILVLAAQTAQWTTVVETGGQDSAGGQEP